MIETLLDDHLLENVWENVVHHLVQQELLFHQNHQIDDSERIQFHRRVHLTHIANMNWKKNCII